MYEYFLVPGTKKCSNVPLFHRVHFQSSYKYRAVPCRTIMCFLVIAYMLNIKSSTHNICIQKQKFQREQ